MVPLLGDVATAIHRAVSPDPVPRVIHTRTDDPDPATVAIGFWDLPAEVDHPADPLVGFLAPADWTAIGIVVPGTLRALGTLGPCRPTITTVLMERDGRVVSILGHEGEALQRLDEPPQGLVPDVLARTLGLPTPAPSAEVSDYLDAAWLDRIAAGLLCRPSRGRSWRWLADRHPLRGGGPPPPPEELAARVAHASTHLSWADLRARMRDTALPASWCGPPGGTLPSASDWFDDGSLSRWVLRQVPPTEVLVPDVLSILPDHVGAQLLLALGSPP